MTNEIAVRESGALDFRASTDAAGMCKEIVTRTAMRIGKRQYVPVEGWQSIAMAHGCVASARDVERIDGGIRAIGEVRRGTDGFVISAAEGFVGDDEETWGNRAEYAKRAMAQTRAISRACRSAFAHVVVMMNAGLETTPAEEVPHGGFDDRPQSRPVSMPKPKPAGKAKSAPSGDAQTTQTTVKTVGQKGKRYWLKGSDGEYYSTFSDKIGQNILTLQAGEKVEVEYVETTGKGGAVFRDLEAIRLADAEPGQDTPDGDDVGF